MAHVISDECVSCALAKLNVQLELSLRVLTTMRSMLMPVLTVALVLLSVQQELSPKANPYQRSKEAVTRKNDSDV